MAKKVTEEQLDEQATELEIEKRKLEEDKETRRRNIFFVLIFLILLFVATFGITVSFYKGEPSNDNQIITDKIVFTYSDVDKGGNGIYLKNAIPITDEQGKAMIGKGDYFDFNVTATSKNAHIKYKVLARKDSVSTLADSEVRVYLASTNDNYERQVLLTTFSNLKRENINDIDYYVLYEKTLDKNIENYSDFYRLKMWVRDNSDNYADKKFMLKVDVIAEQVGD